MNCCEKWKGRGIETQDKLGGRKYLGQDEVIYCPECGKKLETCHQCENPMAKGIHTCEALKPKESKCCNYYKTMTGSSYCQECGREFKPKPKKELPEKIPRTDILYPGEKVTADKINEILDYLKKNSV